MESPRMFNSNHIFDDKDDSSPYENDTFINEYGILGPINQAKPRTNRHKFTIPVHHIEPYQ